MKIELRDLKKNEFDAYRMSYCKTCMKRSKSELKFLVCSITKEYPNFTNECKKFELDKKELDKILNITNSRLRKYFKIIKNPIEQKRTVYPREYLEYKNENNQNENNISELKWDYTLEKINIGISTLIIPYLTYQLPKTDINITTRFFIGLVILFYLYITLKSIFTILKDKNRVFIKKKCFIFKGKKHFWNDIIKVGYGEIQDKHLMRFIYLSKISDSNYDKFIRLEVSSIDYTKLIKIILRYKRNTK